MNKQNNQLIVFAKSPQPGQCKTRLIPLIGKQKACDFYKSLVTHCFQTLNELQGIGISIHVFPDTQDDFLQTLNQQSNFQMHKQQGNDLGERMYFAMQRALLNSSKVVLIGTDTPLLSKAYIDSAFNALNKHDVVYGPAEDGGYVLIGANKIDASLFQNINWSTDKVLQQSLLKSNAADYKVKLLNTLWDIDTPDDYLRYQSLITNNQL